MRIRDTLLALTATVVAGSALAAVATPAAAQDFHRAGFERGYAPAYGYRFERPRFDYRWGYAPPVYDYGYYHRDRHFWR